MAETKAQVKSSSKAIMPGGWSQNICPSSKWSTKCPNKMTPIGICMHNTANSAPATNEINYMNSNNYQVSYHLAVDENQAIQGLPFDRNGWHAETAMVRAIASTSALKLRVARATMRTCLRRQSAARRLSLRSCAKRMVGARATFWRIAILRARIVRTARTWVRSANSSTRRWRAN